MSPTPSSRGRRAQGNQLLPPVPDSCQMQRDRQSTASSLGDTDVTPRRRPRPVIAGQEPLLPAGGSRIREPWKELADRCTVRGQHRRTTSLWPTSIATSTATNDLDILGHEPKMRPIPGQIPGSDGRCVRLRISSIAADHHALRVLFMANTSGPSRLTMDNQNPCSRGLSRSSHVIPKLSINPTCLRRATVPGRVQDRARDGGSPGRGYPVASTPEA